MGSSFPGQSGIPGVRLVAKSKIDNVNYFENLNLLGEDWGSAFVSPMNTLFGTGNGTFSKYPQWAAGVDGNFCGPAVVVNGKFYTPGSTTQRPDVYDTATDVWSEAGLAYPDLNELLTCYSTGSFDYEGNCYYYSNRITASSPASAGFDFRKYNPVSNTWTALASLPATPANLKNVVYAYMGSNGGYGYFMQIVKSASVAYVPSNFPTIYRYHFESNVWSDLAVVPPVIGGGAGANVDLQYMAMLLTNSVSCKYSSTKFLINFKISKLSGYARAMFYNNIFLFDAVTNQFTRFCNFVPRPDLLSNGPTPHYSSFDTRMFYHDGVLYLWSPLFKGLMAYVESSGRQYHIPIAASAMLDPMIAFCEGKIYIWGGHMGDPYAVGARSCNTSGLIIDLVKLTAFLKSSKTIGIKMPVFA